MSIQNTNPNNSEISSLTSQSEKKASKKIIHAMRTLAERISSSSSSGSDSDSDQVSSRKNLLLDTLKGKLNNKLEEKDESNILNFLNTQGYIRKNGKINSKAIQDIIKMKENPEPIPDLEEKCPGISEHIQSTLIEIYEQRQSVLDQIRLELSTPISYSASEPGGTLTSKKLRQTSEILGETLSTPIWLPENLSIVKRCGGGSGSINIIVEEIPEEIMNSPQSTLEELYYSDKTKTTFTAEEKDIINETYSNLEFTKNEAGEWTLPDNKSFHDSLKHKSSFVKYFVKNSAKQTQGHRPESQFSETKSALEFQSGEKNIDGESLANKTELKEFLAEFRLGTTELCLVTKDADVLDNNSTSVHQTRVNYMQKQLTDSDDVLATYAIMDAANAQDLCDVLAEPGCNVDTYVTVYTNYLNGALESGEKIKSTDIEPKDGHELLKEDWLTKMKSRFAGVGSQEHALAACDFSQIVPDVQELHSFQALLKPENTFLHNGKYIPNPVSFLDTLFSTFEDVFTVNKKVFQVHGDGQSSNLMVINQDNDSLSSASTSIKLIQVDTKPGDNSVDPLAELVKGVVFGPEFIGAGSIKPEGASVFWNEGTGLTFGDSNSDELKNNVKFKQQLLANIGDQNSALHNYAKSVSPYPELTIRVLGAIQAEADIGSFLGKLTQCINKQKQLKEGLENIKADAATIETLNAVAEKLDESISASSDLSTMKEELTSKLESKLALLANEQNTFEKRVISDKVLAIQLTSELIDWAQNASPEKVPDKVKEHITSKLNPS